MKISVLCPDLSGNCLGRAYLLAKILQRRYEVEIIGPKFGDSIWQPVADDKSIEYKSVKIKGLFRPYLQLCELMKKIDGDIIYVSKPLFSSFVIGLIKKMITKKPLVLDIDDWEMGFMRYDYSRLNRYLMMKSFIYSAVYLYIIGSYWGTSISERLVRYADALTVSNPFLQTKFGGILLPHGRDTDFLNPEQYDQQYLRTHYGIESDTKAVMFFGTVRPYKGVEDLIDAVGIIEDRNTILILVGIDESPYCQEIVRKAKTTLGNRFKGFGMQPFAKVPEFLAMADVIAIPQKANVATEGQVPAKVFDAMAMAKPIIATDTSDLPAILDGCGWIVEEGNIDQLASTIKKVLDNNEVALQTGQKARIECIKKYSWNALEEVLVGLFQTYDTKNKS